MNDCAIILLGATGDLAKRKIFPALYRLFVQNKLGNSIIIGAALDEITPMQLLENAKHFIKPTDDAIVERFCKTFFLSIN